MFVPPSAMLCGLAKRAAAAAKYGYTAMYDAVEESLRDIEHDVLSVEEDE